MQLGNERVAGLGNENVLCLALVGLLCVCFGAYAAPPERQWVFNQPLGMVDSSPSMVDINGNGKIETIATTAAGCVLALDSAGGLLWNANLKVPFSIPPTTVDLLEDEAPEVLALNQAGILFCLSSRNGAQIWTYTLPGDIEWGTTAIAVADLDGDGTLDIVTGTKQGHVVCLTAQGSRLWQYEGTHGYTLCPAIGALAPGQKPSVVISGTKTPLICLDAQGKERWRVDESARGASPIIADLDGDGKMEILTGCDNALMAVNNDGSVRWRFPMPKEIDSTICVADADEDGVLEVYAIDLSGKLAAVSPDGRELWSADVVERVRRNPAVADINGDGALEVIVGGYDCRLHIFNAQGEPIETLDMRATTNASPTVACFDGDGRPSVLYAADSTETIVLRWPDAKPDAKVAWAEYRWDAARTACYTPVSARTKVRVLDVDFGDFYAGQNTCRIAVENPGGAPLRIVSTVEAGELRESTLDSSETQIEAAAEYVLPTQVPCEVRLSFDVYAGDTRAARRATRAYVVPFAKELDDFAALLGEAEASARQLPEPWAHLGRLAALRETLEDGKAQAAVAGTLSGVEARELRDVLRASLAELERSGRLLEFAVQRHGAGEWPVCLRPANAWTPFAGLDEIAEHRTSGGEVGAFAFQGETEDAAFNAFNLGARPLELRIEISPLALEGASGAEPVPAHKAIRLHEVVSVATQSLDLSADVLPRMNTGYVLTLPAWHARQLWLAIDTDALAPGVWTSSIKARTLEVESRSFEIPLRIEVSKNALPETSTLHHCNWGYVYRTDRMKDFEAETLEDRIAHGNNVFVTTITPLAKYDAEGNIEGEIDFAPHDDFVRRYSPHGMILFHSYSGLRGPAAIDTPAGRRAYVAWLRAWAAHLTEMGIGYAQYAMYPVDEPGLREGLVKRYLDFAKCAREADPKILMYTDPVERIREEELVEMLPYVDIWCPNRTGFFLGRNEDKLEIIQNAGKPVWTYACADNAKHQSPLGYYRGQSWAAYRFNLTGIGFWSYCTSSADPWYRPENTLDYLLVYPGDGVVISKRWEAVRDGIEDYAMLKKLEAAKEKAKAEGRAPGLVQQAEAFLGADAAAIAEYIGRDDDGTTPGLGGLKGVRQVEDKRFDAIQDCRKTIDALLTGLGN